MNNLTTPFRIRVISQAVLHETVLLDIFAAPLQAQNIEPFWRLVARTRGRLATTKKSPTTWAGLRLDCVGRLLRNYNQYLARTGAGPPKLK